jgi:hypothetical protein
LPRWRTRPDRPDRIVETDEAGIDQLFGEQGDDRLPHRLEVDEFVLLPLALPGLAGPAALESGVARGDRFRSALAGAAGLWRDRVDDGLTYQQRVRALDRSMPRQVG